MRINFHKHHLPSSGEVSFYLNELARQYQKLNGKSVKSEILSVGGAAILANYDFWDITTGVDSLIHVSSSMKDTTNMLGNKYNLPNSWLHAYFIRTTSFSNVLQVPKVSTEYLVVMKLVSGR